MALPANRLDMRIMANCGLFISQTFNFEGEMMDFTVRQYLKVAGLIIGVLALWTAALYLGHPEYFHKQPVAVEKPAPVDDTDVFQNMRGDK